MLTKAKRSRRALPDDLLLQRKSRLRNFNMIYFERSEHPPVPVCKKVLFLSPHIHEEMKQTQERNSLWRSPKPKTAIIQRNLLTLEFLNTSQESES